ncbi:Occludin_ELL domain-containing protein [Meloidogyne graminicola]|uniref:Occludin_ELL domain-containing protein n=1 Tax=Meloidogyne graminicola TaxID=189291 RepID=A0A8T0A2L4_9BILA|nr:Occludin_ELL domain-containing protein [Meloidogyne graminicola]
MLKQNIYQHSNLSSSSAHPEQQDPRFDVFELANENQAQSSLMLKLTDECSAAIRNAVNSKSPIRMHVKNGVILTTYLYLFYRIKVATIEICDRDGSSINFKCSFQNQPATDTICYDPKKNAYRNVGTATTTKIQVQATDKTFAEMKEKTQRLVEAEQQKKAKDISKIQRVSTASKKPIQVHQSSASLIKRNVPTTTAPVHSNTNNFLAKLNALKRTHSPSSLNVETTKVKRVEKPLEKPTPLIAKESRAIKQEVPITKNMEVAMKTVRSNECAVGSRNVSPQYTKKLEFAAANTAKADPFYVPKRRPVHRPPSISPASTTSSTPKTISPPLAIARPASVDSAQLQHSSSCSPEDLINNQEDSNRQHEEGSMTLPTKPSCDWAHKFGKITNRDEAKRYHGIFKEDYPEYRKCYDLMEKVAIEFRTLQTKLTSATSYTERLEVEDQIRSKFASYQCNQTFLQHRVRHSDLRAKLDQIKFRLKEWSDNEKNKYNMEL